MSSGESSGSGGGLADCTSESLFIICCRMIGECVKLLRVVGVAHINIVCVVGILDDEGDYSVPDSKFLLFVYCALHALKTNQTSII